MAVFGASHNLAAAGSGALAGLFMALTGGGGSALAAPLMMYVVGVRPARLVMGTTAVAVALIALFGALPHSRRGAIHWAAVMAFTVPGFMGILFGSRWGKDLPGHALLAGLGLLMLFNASFVVRRPEPRPLPARAWTRLPLGWKVAPLGFTVGLIAGLVGMGGGFLVLPSLMMAGVPMMAALGSSLVTVAGLGLANGLEYARRGWVDWRVVALYVAGGALGSVLGSPLARRLAGRGRLLGVVAGVLLLGLSLYLLGTNLPALYTAGILP